STLQALKDACRDDARAVQDERGLKRVLFEGLLLADRFPFVLIRYRALGKAARFAIQIGPPSAHCAGQLLELDPPEISDRPNPALVQRRLGLTADARDDPNWHGIQKTLNGLGSHDRQPIRFLEIRGNF